MALQTPYWLLPSLLRKWLVHFITPELIAHSELSDLQGSPRARLGRQSPPCWAAWPLRQHRQGIAFHSPDSLATWAPTVPDHTAALFLFLEWPPCPHSSRGQLVTLPDSTDMPVVWGASSCLLERISLPSLSQSPLTGSSGLFRKV